MEANKEELSGLLYEGIMMEVEMWDVLTTALSQNWGKGSTKPADVNPEMVFTGTNDEIIEKISIYLVNTVMEYVIDREELQSDITEIMLINFDVILEDNSDLMLAGSIMKLYEELKAGKDEYLKMIRERYDKFLKKSNKPSTEIKMQDESSSSEEEKESEDEDGFRIAK